jgi:hypothetical protein
MRKVIKSLKLLVEDIGANTSWVGGFDGEEAYECVDSIWRLGEIGEVF